jgi:hypothetical protein
MTSQERLDISARLEKAVARITGPPDNPEELYERWENSAISLLDSECYNYPDGELYSFLLDYLRQKRGQFGLKPLD